jgi:hypothetical protein
MSCKVCEVVTENASYSCLKHLPATRSQADIAGFVASNMKECAFRVLGHVIDQILHEASALREDRGKRPRLDRIAARSKERLHGFGQSRHDGLPRKRLGPGVLDFGKPPVGRVREESRLVTEALQDGNHLHVVTPSLRDDLPQLPGGQWSRACGRVRMRREPEGILDVELIHVELVVAEMLYDRAKVGDRGHLAAAQVVRYSPPAKRGLVPDNEAREPSVRHAADDLAERLP